MAIFKTKEKSPLYHAGEGNQWNIRNASIEDVQKWAEDPNCIEREQCAQIFRETVAKQEELLVEVQERLAAKRDQLQANPFDPRTEISADAEHIAGRIVKHLWIIFVLLPIVLGVLYAILK
jgi:hypothetical protein